MAPECHQVLTVIAHSLTIFVHSLVKYGGGDGAWKKAKECIIHENGKNIPRLKYKLKFHTVKIS